MGEWMQAIRKLFYRLYRRVTGRSPQQKLMVTAKIRRDKTKTPLVLKKENDIFLYQTSKTTSYSTPVSLKPCRCFLS